jgi:hypothetical protein
MRSIRAVKVSDCQCRSRYGLGFDPSIFEHSGICGAADDAVLNNVLKKSLKIQENSLSNLSKPAFGTTVRIKGGFRNSFQIHRSYLKAGAS